MWFSNRAVYLEHPPGTGVFFALDGVFVAVLAAMAVGLQCSEPVLSAVFASYTLANGTLVAARAFFLVQH